jgi:hypothetical protein
MEDVATIMKKELNSKESWIHIFVETKDIFVAKNKKRFIQIFGVYLASSNPSKLFDPGFFYGNKLLETPTTRAWAAAYAVYGPGWLHEKDVFTIGTERKAPTQLTKTCKSEEIEKALPFTSDEVFAEDSESLHNLEITMKRLLHVRAKGKEVIQPSVWADTTLKKLQHPKVKQVCLRLAKTPVTMFSELNCMANNELDQMSVTSIWMGAYQSLGCLVSVPISQEPIKEPSKLTMILPAKINEIPQAKATKGIKFSDDTKPAAKPKPKLCITKERPKAAPNTMQVSKRKYKGYYKAKLPATVNPFGPKAVEEVTTHCGNLTETIWAIDNKAEILTWHETTTVKPLPESSAAITTKDQLSKYVANVYMEQAKNTWLRFQIAHDVDKSKFQNEAFTETHIQVS